MRDGRTDILRENNDHLFGRGLVGQKAIFSVAYRLMPTVLLVFMTIDYRKICLAGNGMSECILMLRTRLKVFTDKISLFRQCFHRYDNLNKLIILLSNNVNIMSLLVKNLADPLGQPKFTVGRDHFFHTFCTFKSTKTKQQKTMFATG